MKSRSFVVTNFNLNTAEVYEANKKQIKFIAFGLETCPTTQRQHHQCFLYFFNPRGTGNRSLNAIGNMFGTIHAHVEVMRGSFTQNEAYCAKEDVYTQLGEKPLQGRRGDLLETRTSVLAGSITVDDVAIEDPITYHMYGRTLERLESIRMRSIWRKEMTTCTWYWGKTGVGKSHKAFKDYSNNTHYIKDLSTKWWDGYKQQETVILNEFRGQLSFSFLLSMIDKWPLTVPIRNKESIPFTSKHVIITSSLHPRDVYINVLTNDESFAQLERRIKIKQLINIFNN